MLILNYFFPSLVTIKSPGPLIEQSFNGCSSLPLDRKSVFFSDRGKKKGRLQGAAGCSLLVLVHWHALQPKEARNKKEKEAELHNVSG